MPEITRVRERRGRARIFVDGEFWAEIDADVAVERGLREGAALGLEELEAARVAGERALAMNRALHFLGYRARSRSEVRLAAARTWTGRPATSTTRSLPGRWSARRRAGTVRGGSRQI